MIYISRLFILIFISLLFSGLLIYCCDQLSSNCVNQTWSSPPLTQFHVITSVSNKIKSPSSTSFWCICWPFVFKYLSMLNPGLQQQEGSNCSACRCPGRCLKLPCYCKYVLLNCTAMRQVYRMLIKQGTDITAEGGTENFVSSYSPYIQIMM